MKFLTFGKIETKHTLFILLIVAFLVFAPGLMGDFFLDDNVNLKTLNVFSSFDGFEAYIRYILSNDAGPLKRPISTLSFLINAQSWPTIPYYFKLTNLFIHLLNGLLLYIVTRKILLLLKYDIKNITKIAIFSAALWLLNPYMVSTVLYVVQRMAMLPVTFVLIGMNLYLKGRMLIMKDINIGKYYMYASILLFTPLAALSKENGIILPFLILALEYVLSQNIKTNSFITNFKKYFLIVPTLIIILALILKLPDFLQSYTNRDFTMIERLLTQSRVLVASLYHLFTPEIITEGIYTDGFSISKSLFSPITTLYSLIIVAVLLTSSFVLRRRAPLLSFSILFFFIGHLIESSIVPLEIYFEHRNYLPSVFLYTYIASLIISLQGKSKVFTYLPYLIIGIFALTTYQKSTIWRDSVKMTKLTMEKYPHSYRATEKRIADLYLLGQYRNAQELLERTNESFSSISFGIKLFSLNCQFNKADEDGLFKHMEKTEVITRDKTSLTAFFSGLLNKSCGDDSLEIMEKALSIIKKKNGSHKHAIQQTILFFESMLLLKQNDVTKSKKMMLEYIEIYDGYFDMIIAIKRFIAKGYSNEAQELINKMRKILVQRNALYVEHDYMKELSELEKSM